VSTDEQRVYPPYVETDEQRRRWDLCADAAEGLFADLDESQRVEQVWSATRAFYTSDIPTDLPASDASETIPG
jgi:hypothetical protein